jgi:oligopeptidase A
VSANNPLLQPYDLPPFSAIRAEHVLPAIEQILADNRAAIAEILKARAKPDLGRPGAGHGRTERPPGRRLEPGQPPQRRVQQRRTARGLRVRLPAERLLHRMGQNRELFRRFRLPNSPEAAGFDVAQKPF